MKTRFFRWTLFCLCVNIFPVVQAQETSPQLGKNSVAEVIKAMTLEEKASLVVGTGLRFEGSGPVIGEADGRVPGAAGNTMSIKQLKIPGSVLSDGPAGVRIDPYHKGDSSKSYYATAFPVGTLLASSWDTALVRRVGLAFGNEIKEYGVDVILGPGMNIQRDPLNGRNFEYYSEDPMISGYISSAMVQGIQANDVGTSIKHFAANNQESSRGSINVIVSERALREIYLRGFEIAVKNAHPWTVMSSYNKINGTYTSQSRDLLTNILRDEWGFKGMVMTDWYGGRDVIAQMNAGNDLIEPGIKSKTNDIVAAVKNGKLDEKILDQNVDHILNYLLKTPSFSHFTYSNTPDLRAHAAVTRNAAAQSMVLLKNNNNSLPLKKVRKIALFGNTSYDPIIGGTGSGGVNTAYKISISQGLTNAGYSLNDDLTNSYTEHIRNDKLSHMSKTSITLGTPRIVPELFPDSATIKRYAKEADVAIFTIGRNAGEGADRKIDNFNLTDTERLLINTIAASFHAKGKRFIIIMNIGGTIETSSWRDQADAILLAWQPGLEEGNSVTDVLNGTVNPSGKLAITFPVKYADEPTAKNFPGTPVNNPSEVRYEEGIYVGYRYFNTYHIKPSYEFGYGLSYTHFSYSPVKLSTSTFKNEVRASITITNTGTTAGKEVVELYLTAPSNKMDKPAEELKAFAKTALLQPGKSQTISFTLHSGELASFDTNSSSWISDKGKYTIKIGASSLNIKSSASFNLSEDILVEKVHKALVPQVTINELKGI
jgi:beta-glucosidase